MLAVIPFSGFYESWHDAEIDRALEQMCDSVDNGDANSDLLNYAYSKGSFRETYEKYAKAYAENFCEKFGIKAEFESLQSPKEYNFTTDRVFVTISEEEVERLFHEVSVDALNEVCKEMFTSRSGFISFYRPHFTQWKAPKEWDHNQVYALITAIVKTAEPEFDQQAEVDLMHSETENGRIEGWLYEDEHIKRAADIAGYLRKREERK